MGTTKKIKGYSIDFTTNTLVMNYKFATAAKEYGTPEYKLVRSIQKDFPLLTVSVQPGREVTTPSANKRLTYENMAIYIAAHENAAELEEVFKTVKALSKPLASPYKYVCDWFEKQFPNYRKTPALKDGKLIVLPVNPPDQKDYKYKLSEEKLG